MASSIRLFWWSEPKLMGKPYENYGDLLGVYIVEKMSQKQVVFAHPKKRSFKDLLQPIYVTAGSILAHVNKKCIVWGSGIIKKDQVVKPAKFLAVRGPETRNNLLKQGYDVPEIYGDPGLLLPRYYNPVITKKYKLGIIPHYVDIEIAIQLTSNQSDIHIIDLMTNDIEKTTDQILQCKRVISSSLHGLIVSHAYGIPAVWIQFSDNLFGDNIKFRDYFSSVDLSYLENKWSSPDMSESEIENYFTENALPKQKRINDLQSRLIESCPFNN